MLYKYPQARVPLRAAGRGEPPPRHGRARVRARSTPASSTTTATSTSFVEYAKAEPGRHPDARSRSHNRGPDAGDAARAAAALVPQHLVAGRRARRGRPLDAAASTTSSRHRAPGLGDYYAPRRRRAASCSSPTTRPTPRALSASDGAGPSSRTPSTTTSSTGRIDAVNPEPARHQGRGALTAAPSRRAARCRVRARASRRAHGRDRFDDFDAICSTGAARGRRVLRRARRTASPTPDARARAAPGVRRHDLDQAVLPLRRAATGSTATRPAAAARRSAQARPQPRVASTSTTPTSSRCRTSGSTRGTPPGTSRSTASRSRWSTRSSPSDQLVLLTREWYMHPNGQLPAYEWAFGDVNPPVHAWAAWRVFQIDRERRGGDGRPRLPRARLPQADAELHLVGEPQGRRGPQRLPGRLPRARQHRRLRPQRAAADRRLHRPGRRHRLDGDVLPEPDAHRARARAAQSRLRGHRDQVLRALPAHRRGDDEHRRRAASACGTSEDEFYYDVLHLPDGRTRAAARCARWSG